uniref:hypothetical protein n=1 Tax=uncultured Draconibacterium sp. TaxID=1573823 RepID=UPI00321735C3
MKIIKVTTIAFVIGILLLSCSKTTTETFDAKFTGEYVRIYTGVEVIDCADEYECRVVVDFEGTASQFGKVKGTFNFCACGPDGKYAPTDSYFVSSTGDSLFFTCHGNVIEGRLDDHPEFVTSYWRDPFVITGGTGRFEGATGGGTTDDYNSSEDPNSHHHWMGTITLKKE